MAMVKLKNMTALPLLVLGVAFPPDKEVEVTEEAAWTIRQKYGDDRLKIVAGKPTQPTPTPKRYIGRAAVDEVLRVPDARAISVLPPCIPSDVRGAIRKDGWREQIPALCEKVNGAYLALWCALSELPEQAEAVLKYVTVTE